MHPATGKKPHINEELRPPRLAPIRIPNDKQLSTSSDEHPYPPEYEGHLEGVMITNEEILSRTAALAELIQEDYKDERPVFVCVLKGASMFFHHLTAELQKLRQGFSYEFLRAQSYEGTETSGNVKFSNFNFSLLNGKSVIIVEDIVDTGTTLAKLVPVIEREGRPKSVEVCTLLEKRIDHERRRAEIPAQLAVVARYSGFSIPNKFVIGFGLDYNELYRDLRDIWLISNAGIDFDGNL